MANSPFPKAGFGLGALNEAEDDDVDVYGSTSRTERTYMPYDAIRDADEGASVSGSKSSQKVVRVFQEYVCQRPRQIIGRPYQPSSGSQTR